MKKIHPAASPPTSEEHSPLKDLTNTIERNANPTSCILPEKKQGWYARLSDEKKAEYLQKRRMARQQQKAAASLINVNSQQVSKTPASSMPSIQRTPLSTVTNTYKTGIVKTLRSRYICLP